VQHIAAKRYFEKLVGAGILHEATGDARNRVFRANEIFRTYKKPVRVRLLSLPNIRNESQDHCLIKLTFTLKCQEWITKS